MTSPLTSSLTWVSHLCVAVVGVVVAVAATVVHRVDVPAFGVQVPVGLVLGVTTTFAVAWSLRLVLVPSRLATSYAVGWVVAFAVLLLGRPEGDYLVAGDGLGYGLVLAGVVLLGLGVFSGVSARDTGSTGRAT